jgi:hypothetical protein
MYGSLLLNLLQYIGATIAISIAAFIIGFLGIFIIYMIAGGNNE